jgi:hypothetical protein
MTAEQEKLTKLLKRLVLAGVAFRQVGRTCQHLLADNSVEQQAYYGCVFAGICVAYMRPFMSSAGLGPLSPKYEDFPADSDHLRTHSDLKKGRNTAYAHYSPGQAATLLTDSKAQAEQLRLRIRISGDSVFFSPPEVVWSRERLPAIIGLCKYQEQRTQEEIRGLVRHWRAGKDYPDGEYIVGESFP